jgi:hypothetical protein
MSIRRSILLALAVIFLSGFTEKQIEEANQWSQKTIEAFGACLRSEVEKQSTLSMTPADFALYVKGVCQQEAQAFRVPFVDLLAMKYPSIDGPTGIAQANEVLEQWRNAAVKLYVETLYESK